MQKQPWVLPLKSVAGALLFSIFLGPVGLLYSSVWGGVLMIVLGFIVVSAKFIVPIILVWLISCIWSASAVNRYNKKIMDIMRNEKNNSSNDFRSGNI